MSGTDSILPPLPFPFSVSSSQRICRNPIPTTTPVTSHLCLWTLQSIRRGVSTTCCTLFLAYNSFRLARPFVPPRATLKQIHDAVPKHLLKKDPLRSFGYVARDVSLCVAMFTFAAYIDPISRSGCFGLIRAVQPWQIALLKTASWLFYWWWQSLVFTSFFCIGKHMTLADKACR